MIVKLVLNRTKWPRLFRRVELFFKAIVTPRGKNFFCDSKSWQLCYICGALRYMARNQLIFNPRNYVWRVYSVTRFYIITKDDVTSFPIESLRKRPCAELTTRS